MSNLTPTPRVDKNGTIVVRHMKQQPNPAPASLPSPTLAPKVVKTDVSGGRQPYRHAASKESDALSNPIARWMNKRKREKLTGELTEELFAHGREVHRYANRDTFTNAVGDVLSTDEIKLALVVVKAVTRSDVPDELADKDRTAVINAIETLTYEISGDRVRALHANMDWLRNHPGEAWKLNKLTSTLREYGIEAAGGNGKIPNLDAYLEAEISPSYEGLRRSPDAHMDFLIGAASHPDKLDQLAAYVVERDAFDEDGFEQYLNTTTPLAEGSL